MCVMHVPRLLLLTAARASNGTPWKVFVSAIPTVQFDRLHHLSSSDARLSRRLLRDWRTRGHSALSSLKKWRDVRLAEDTHIFPHQSSADFFLNSWLPYEPCVLAPYLRGLLAEVDGDPAAVAIAQRLLTLSTLWYPLPEADIPPNSVLREFFGGSVFADA